MKRIDKITLVKMLDEYPDLSWLGEYGGTPQKGACHRHNAGSREFKYFYPANLEHRWEDFKQMERFADGSLYMIGVNVEVLLSVSDDDGQTWFQTKLESTGVWGISSDTPNELLEIEFYPDQVLEIVEEYELHSEYIAYIGDLGINNAIDIREVP